MILLETGVLIRHLRRREGFAPIHPYTAEIRRLAKLRAVVGIPGMALQEVLAGATDDANSERWAGQLRAAAPTIAATEEEWELAGRLSSFCRRKGVTTGAPDALMAAQSLARDAPLFAEDGDYAHIHGVFPLLRLHRCGDVPDEVVGGVMTLDPRGFSDGRPVA